MNCGLLRLRCRVQHYGWGDTDFIPALLGIDNPEREFELRRMETGAGQPHQNSAEIVILVVAEEDARLTVESGDRSLERRRGDVFLAPFGTPYTVSAAGPATLYKATVPTAGPPSGPGRGDRGRGDPGAQRPPAAT